jgi:benzoate-CoA ligase family protein
MKHYNAAEWLLDRHIADGRGGATAIRCRGESYRYADVLIEVWRVQNALRALDVVAGERVVLVMNDEPELVAWMLGCERAGVVPVPLSTMSTANDLAAIVQDCQAVLIVTSDIYAPMIEPLAAHAPSLRHAVVTGPGVDVVAPCPVLPWSAFADASEVSPADTGPDSAAFWLYSSGTTGLPKGVIHRHSSQQATYETYATGVLGISPGDSCLSVAKLFFAYGLGNSLTFPFGAGARTVLEPRRPTPATVCDLVRAEQPTLFFASPGFVAAILDAGVAEDTFASVRCTVTAGETLPADLQRRFSQRFGHAVLDGIGSTEALHIFLSNTVADQRPGSTGVVVPGYELTLLDEQGQPIDAPDTPGYLHVRGPSTALGYWNKPEATAAAFRADRWLRTGDVYTRSGDGHWTFLGRNNDMIKAGGIWVSPAEVESVLIEHPDVLEAAVVGSRNDAGLETVVAFVVARSGQTIDERSIEHHCRMRMAAYKRPRRLIVVGALPKTATGKVQRFALRERLSAQHGPQQ